MENQIETTQERVPIRFPYSIGECKENEKYFTKEAMSVYGCENSEQEYKSNMARVSYFRTMRLTQQQKRK